MRGELLAQGATVASSTEAQESPVKRTPVFAAALAALAIAIPAGASPGDTIFTEPTATATETPTETSTEPTWVPNTALQNVYFLCDGEYPEGTLNAATSNHYASWNEEKPTASIATGAGCGQVDEGFFGGIRPQTPFEFSAVGYYTGNLDSLTFSMHNIFVGSRRRTGASTVNVRLLVDGESVFGVSETENAAGDVSTEPTAKSIPITPKGTGATGAAALYEATITGIDHLLPSDNIEHEVVFNITTLENVNVWAWGNAEAPSGLTFNPTEPAAVRVASKPRNSRS